MSSQFRPYITAEEGVPEFTVTAVVLGILQAVLFGVADAYLALKLGMTVGASIPAAVISMSLLRGVLKRGTILENNLVQNMASVGESLAGGATFTIPALYLLQDMLVKKGEPLPFPLTLPQVYFLICMGGLMGIFFMIPMRRYLIVKEHGRLRYPEGTACAEVLMAGDQGGQSAATVFAAMGIAALYRLAMNALGLFKEIVVWPVKFLSTQLSFDLLPSLMAVGFILGLETCALMLSGALLGWLVIIPLIAYFGQAMAAPLPPATELISAMTPDDLWAKYLRYVGAGAVAFGGLISLGKALPTIIESIRAAFADLMGKPELGPATVEAPAADLPVRAEIPPEGGPIGAPETPVDEAYLGVRQSKDIPLPWVLGVWALIFVLVGLNTGVNLSGFLGAFLTVVFAFFFVTVSSRIVGIVGTTSMPLSGMTIGALLVTCLVISRAGYLGPVGMGASLVVASMVCIAISMGGDISQDLKIGFLVGATPRWVQVTQVISVLTSSVTVCFIIDFMAKGVIEHKYLAPQANLLFLITQGVFEGNLPWVLVVIGMAIGACVEMLGLGSLPFAIGLYLPLELSTTLLFGGLLHWGFHAVYPRATHKKLYDHGLLVCSGLVAGDALVGVALGYLSYKDYDFTGRFSHPLSQNQGFAMACFLLLCLYLFVQVRKAAERAKLEEGGTEP